MILDEFVDTFASKEQSETREGGYIYYGSSLGMNELELWNRIPESFKPAWGWCNEPYRVVWVSFNYRSVITYCEGDVSVFHAPDTDTSFVEYMLGARVFYEKPRNMDLDFIVESNGEHRDPEGQAMEIISDLEQYGIKGARALFDFESGYEVLAWRGETIYSDEQRVLLTVAENHGREVRISVGGDTCDEIEATILEVN